MTCLMKSHFFAIRSNRRTKLGKLARIDSLMYNGTSVRVVTRWSAMFVVGLESLRMRCSAQAIDASSTAFGLGSPRW